MVEAAPGEVVDWNDLDWVPAPGVAGDGVVLFPGVLRVGEMAHWVPAGARLDPTVGAAGGRVARWGPWTPLLATAAGTVRWRLGAVAVETDVTGLSRTLTVERGEVEIVGDGEVLQRVALAPGCVVSLPDGAPCALGEVLAVDCTPRFHPPPPRPAPPAAERVRRWQEGERMTGEALGKLVKCLGDDPAAVLASAPPDAIDALREVGRREHLVEEHLWLDSSSPDFDEPPESRTAAEERSATRFRRGLRATRRLLA